jgi:3-hydroxybutyryl-CoA dehydratase
MNGYKNFEEIAVGDKMSYAKTMTETETYLGVGLIGALNPIHIDEEYCKTTRFKKRIGVGLLIYALTVSVAENFMVGPGTQLVSVDVKFTAPVYFGDTIRAEVEVISKDPVTRIVAFRNALNNQDGITVLVGEFSLNVREVK